MKRYQGRDPGFNSLEYYKGTGYGKINAFLRDPGFDEKLLIKDNIIHNPEIKHILNIDRLLKNNNFGNTIFYRGVSGGIIPIIKNSSGIMINIAYSSCTKREDVLKSFTNETGCCVLVFSIPDNIKTYEYKEEGKLLNEAEVLIQRNTQFRILKQINKNYYLAELISYIIPKTSFNTLSLADIDERRKKIFDDEEDDLFKSDDEETEEEVLL